MQELLGSAFKSLQNKRVLVRHPGEFADFEFGVYWDSWAHNQQLFGKCMALELIGQTQLKVAG